MSETEYREPPTQPATGQIAAALSAFQGEMPTVPKSHTATVKSDKGNYSYTYAGLADVTEAAAPLLAKHGLAFVTLPENGRLVGLLLHASGESLSASLPLGGGTPQQIGSSLTYMRRYLFGCMTGLVTDDDDDGRGAQQAGARSKPARTGPAANTAGRAAAAPPAETGELMSAKTRGHLFALFGAKGVAEADQLPGVNHVCGTDYTSRSQITEADAQRVITVLTQRPDAPTEPTATEATA